MIMPARFSITDFHDLSFYAFWRVYDVVRSTLLPVTRGRQIAHGPFLLPSNLDPF